VALDQQDAIVESVLAKASAVWVPAYRGRHGNRTEQERFCQIFVKLGDKMNKRSRFGPLARPAKTG